MKSASPLYDSHHMMESYFAEPIFRTVEDNTNKWWLLFYTTRVLFIYLFFCAARDNWNSRISHLLLNSISMYLIVLSKYSKSHSANFLSFLKIGILDLLNLCTESEVKYGRK